MNTTRNFIVTFSLLWLSLSTIASFAIADDSQSISVLTYHDIVPDAKDLQYTISRSALVSQLDYIETHGYQPISLSFLEKVHNGRAKLPKNAVLLTFDDGLESYYKFVWPLLKIYGYPSVISIVTSWIDGKDIPAEYIDKLMSWDQLSELAEDKNVEIISHTHNLHRSILSNPQGNEAAASIARQYFPVENTYESEQAYRERVNEDLAFAVARFKQKLGFSPRAIAWPYGFYNSTLIKQTESLGMFFHLTLDEKPSTLAILPKINRKLILNSSNFNEFVTELNGIKRPERRRFVEINLDEFSGTSLEQQDVILSNILDRLVDLDVDMVVVNPFSSSLSKSFFVNDQIKMDVDILNRVLHQIKYRVGIQNIYLSLPNDVSVKNQSKMYTDLARLNWFGGVIFEAKASVKSIKQTVEILSQYRPKLRVGIRDNSDLAYNFDFIVSTIELNASAEEVQNKLSTLSGIPLPVYVSLHNTSSNNESELQDTIKTIKAMGVNNYGYYLGSKLTQSESDIMRFAKKILQRGD